MFRVQHISDLIHKLCWNPWDPDISQWNHHMVRTISYTDSQDHYLWHQWPHLINQNSSDPSKSLRTALKTEEYWTRENCLSSNYVVTEFWKAKRIKNLKTPFQMEFRCTGSDFKSLLMVFQGIFWNPDANIHVGNPAFYMPWHIQIYLYDLKSYVPWEGAQGNPHST